MDMVQRILKYLKVIFGKDSCHLQIEVYMDANWVGFLVDRRSTMGYCTFVRGNLVTWRSKKQTTEVRSSAEAEFWTMNQGN